MTELADVHIKKSVNIDDQMAPTALSPSIKIHEEKATVLSPSIKIYEEIKNKARTVAPCIVRSGRLVGSRYSIYFGQSRGQSSN